MEKKTRKYLAKVAEKAALIPFHSFIEGKESNLEPIIRYFPKWTLREADGLPIKSSPQNIQSSEGISLFI